MSQELSTEISALITRVSPAALGPESREDALPETRIRADLNAAYSKFETPRNADLVLGLILLWHDHLDASHHLSQAVNNQDGSLVHAIMHRREPDYSNAKYWWRATGNHPCYPALSDRVAQSDCIDEALREQIIPAGKWDPFAFTDAVASGIRLPTDAAGHAGLCAIQQIEFEVVLDYLLS